MKRRFMFLTTCFITFTIMISLATSVSSKVFLYTDVNDEHWAYDAIEYVSDRKWFGGYADGNFLPNNTITRAEAAKVISSFLSLRNNPVLTRDFDDVEPDAWYATYVQAVKKLFPNTIEGNLFKPNEPITREETIYILVNVNKLNTKIKFLDLSLIEAYTDSDRINEEVKMQFAIGVQTSLVSGYSDGTIRPDSPLTRAEFATLLQRAKKLSK